MERQIVVLSYPISPTTTFLPKSIGPPKIHARSRIVKAPEGVGETETRWGSYNNTSIIEMCLHTGTHIDLPFHVDAKGLTLENFTIDDFVFDHPLLIELPKDDFQEITRADLSRHETELQKCDLLLVYTGFSKHRSEDPQRYETNQPGFSVEAAEYIARNLPNIRALGIDALGIENIVKARPNFPAHKALLVGRRFFQVEDANIAPIAGQGAKLAKVYVIPLWVKAVEALPVTVFAEMER